MSQLIAQGDLPRPIRRGAHDLVASTRRYIELLRTSRTNLGVERTRMTAAKADQAELDLRHRAGQLVEVAKVEQLYFERGRQVRDAILSAPDRLSGMLAAEHDQTKIHALMTKELHQTLEALTS